MSDHLITSFVTVVTAIIGVAIIAILVSKNANTANVLTAGGSAFAGILQTAESPITGGGGLGSAVAGIGRGIASGLLG